MREIFVDICSGSSLFDYRNKRFGKVRGLFGQASAIRSPDAEKPPDKHRCRHHTQQAGNFKPSWAHTMGRKGVNAIERSVLMSKPLVVYYSRTGRTRYAAEKLAEHLGADIEEIVEAKSRSGMMGWLGAARDTVTDRATELSSTHDTAGRPMVVLAMPVWASAAPPAVRTY